MTCAIGEAGVGLRRPHCLEAQTGASPLQPLQGPFAATHSHVFLRSESSFPYTPFYTSPSAPAPPIANEVAACSPQGTAARPHLTMRGGP